MSGYGEGRRGRYLHDVVGGWRTGIDDGRLGRELK